MKQRAKAGGVCIPVKKESVRKILKDNKIKFTELARVTGWTDKAIRRAIDREYMPLTLYIQIMDYAGVNYLITFKELVAYKKKGEKTTTFVRDEWNSDVAKKKKLKEKQNEDNNQTE